MIMKRHSILLTAALGLSVCTLSAQKIHHVRTLPILELSADARTAALGGSHYGESDQSYLFTNPTSLLYSDHILNVSGTLRTLGKVEGMEGSQSFYQGSAAVAIGNHGFYVGGRYLGGLSFYPVGKSEQVKSKALKLRDYTLDLAYALRMGHFSGYITGNFVYTDLGRRTSTATIGGGLFWRNNYQPQLSGLNLLVGVKAQNFGLPFKYRTSERNYFTPASVGAGAEVSFNVSGQHRATLTAGADHYVFPRKSSSTALHVGGEYLYHQHLAARLGYHHDTNGYKALSVGLGARYSGVALDAAFVAPTNSDVNSSLLVTLGFSL